MKKDKKAMMMKTSEALMQILRTEGVEYVFGLPGSTEVLFLDALEDHPEMKYILGLHEGVAVAIADGYSRASGKVGVVNLHSYPGIGTAMAMLLNARDGAVPLVVTAGQQDTRLLIQEPQLGGDLVGLGKQFAKWSTEVSYAHDLAIVMRRAFKVAAEAPTGPVFISLPMNVLAESLDFEYLPNPPLAFSRRRPDQGIIDKATELVLRAQTLAIIVGSGVAKYEAVPEVVKLAETTGAAVYQPSMTDVNFPTSHPQHLGDFGPSNVNLREFLRSVDVLIAIGAPVFRATSLPSNPLLTTRTKVIQIDSDAWEIAKNYPVAAGIEGDIKLSVAELNDALQKKMSTEARQAASARAREITEKKEGEKQAFLKQTQSERDSVPISVSRLMQDLGGSLKPGMVVVNDSWSSSATLHRCIDFIEPKSYHLVRGATMGWGMPAALGIKLALPDRPVVAVVGDGSAIFSVQSLWTAAHYNIPVTYIICANASYGMVKLMKIRLMGEQARGKFLGLDIDEPRIDFCQLAQGMGVQGQKVEQPEKLKEALTSALESGRPSIVEVTIEDTV